ncbi:hypothetical protein niasHT_000738 [Heterodera trifolii]|uniref:Kazal-like domain-containing protein n=1 Tax=Heterodera trifolii TaxID=157864 RepID=A0ABD2LN34_9BILA
MSVSAAHVLCFSLVALSSSALLTAADLSLSPLSIDCLCLRSFRPVCGTDQQTYDNICFLHCAKSLNAELRLAYDGVCCPRAELCTDYEDTVCDQFAGVRYDNDCVFEFHKCIRRRRIGGEALRVVGRGERMCGAKRRVAASEQRAATTASTARPSAAFFWSSNGTARANGTTNSSVFSCDFPCESAVAPVCDSQGQTHQNRCKFDLAICRLYSRGIVSALRISRDGPCPMGDQQQQIAKTEKNGDKLGEDDAKGSKTIRTIAERTEKGNHNTNDQQKQQQPSDHSSVWPPFFPKGISLEEVQRQVKVPKTMECDFCREETPFGQKASLCDNANSTHQSLCSFARWNCERKKRGTEEKIFVHLGECNLVSPVFQLKVNGKKQYLYRNRIGHRMKKCPTKCSRKVKSVCDSNAAFSGKTGVPSVGCFPCASVSSEMAQKLSQWQRIKKAPEERNNAIECPAEPKCEGTTEKQQKAEEGAEEEGPICDSNGRTHKNICMFAHAHCLAAKDGQLLRIAPIERCEHSLPKVPGETIAGRGDSQTTDKTEDKTGGNSGECERKWALCKRNTTEQQSHTVDDDAPYCGTDFITYHTSCDFQLAKCKSDNKLDLLFKGPCELCLAKECHRSDRFSITADDDDSHFVCDQNGETLSRCEFEMLRCVVQTNLGYNVTFTHEGKCCPTEAKCPPAKMPRNSLEEVWQNAERRKSSERRSHWRRDTAHRKNLGRAEEKENGRKKKKRKEGEEKKKEEKEEEEEHEKRKKGKKREEEKEEKEEEEEHEKRKKGKKREEEKEEKEEEEEHEKRKKGKKKKGEDEGGEGRGRGAREEEEGKEKRGGKGGEGRGRGAREEEEGKEKGGGKGGRRKRKRKHEKRTKGKEKGGGRRKRKKEEKRSKEQEIQDRVAKLSRSRGSRERKRRDKRKRAREEE